MKSIFLSGIFALYIFPVFSQTTSAILVAGNCDMCKKRIESAVDLKGVKKASWNTSKKILTVSYDPKKITLDQIINEISLAGHDSEWLKADSAAYENLHNCCQYERMEPSVPEPKMLESN
jgi:copper chaperone CopZ